MDRSENRIIPEDDVMEMANHPVGVVEMDIRGQSPLEQPSQTPDGEEKDEGEGKQQGGLKLNGALVKRGHPVEDFDGAWNSDQEGEKGEED
jgi:hypothetical protein